MLDYSPKKVSSKNLEPESFNDEKTSSSKFTIPDPDENEILRMQLAGKEAINRKFQKEREENKELLGWIFALKKKNEISANAW